MSSSNLESNKTRRDRKAIWMFKFAMVVQFNHFELTPLYITNMQYIRIWVCAWQCTLVCVCACVWRDTRFCVTPPPHSGSLSLDDTKSRDIHPPSVNGPNFRSWDPTHKNPIPSRNAGSQTSRPIFYSTYSPENTNRNNPKHQTGGTSAVGKSPLPSEVEFASQHIMIRTSQGKVQ